MSNDTLSLRAWGILRWYLTTSFVFKESLATPYLQCSRHGKARRVGFARQTGSIRRVPSPSVSSFPGCFLSCSSSGPLKGKRERAIKRVAGSRRLHRVTSNWPEERIRSRPARTARVPKKAPCRCVPLILRYTLRSPPYCWSIKRAKAR